MVYYGSMKTHWIIDEIKHLQQCGGEIDWISMVIASDYFRKMGTMEVQEACQVLKEHYPDILADMVVNYPDRVK